MKKAVNALEYVMFLVIFMGITVLVSGTVQRKNAGGDFILSSADGYVNDGVSQEKCVVVIDPGHGGEDGGASAGDVTEKELNLKISENIADILTVYGINCRLTRSDDRLLYDLYGDLSDYTGKKKTYDLRNRLRVVEDEEPELFLGIHMNKFSVPKYKGLQVYYSPNSPKSEIAARLIQESAKNNLAPDNNRQIKKAGSGIYLLNRMKVPGVLVECGFLSNPEELELLSSEDYRKKCASVIAEACRDFLSGAK